MQTIIKLKEIDSSNTIEFEKQENDIVITAMFSKESKPSIYRVPAESFVTKIDEMVQERVI